MKFVHFVRATAVELYECLDVFFRPFHEYCTSDSVVSRNGLSFSGPFRELDDSVLGHCNIISRITRIHIKYNTLNRHAYTAFPVQCYLSYRFKNNHFTTRRHNTYIIILLSFVYYSVHQSK